MELTSQMLLIVGALIMGAEVVCVALDPAEAVAHDR